MSSFESIVPPPLALLNAKRGHSPAVRIGSLLLISGMLGRTSDLEVVTEPEAQLVQLFENMALVLAEAGSSWDHVAELTAYFTHLKRDFGMFMKIRNRYIGEPHPAMTMIGVAELAQPGLICEVKGIAVIPGTAPLNGKP